MPKVSTVNVVATGADVGFGLFTLSSLLRANGWTLVSAGTGAVRRVTPFLSQAEWIAAVNTWEILNRGSVWLSVQRVTAASVTVRFAVTLPATVGTGAVMDSQVTIANQVQYISLGITGANRVHAITSDSDENAAGIRSFYLLFTDGTSTLRGSIALEAMANGTYAVANPAPYAVAAASAGTPFATGNLVWCWWYSVASIWTALTSVSAILSAITSPAGVNPWSTDDQGIPATWGRPVSGVTPGLLGQGATSRAACVSRGYPDTVNLATDAYVYASAGITGSTLIPWPNTVVPL